MNHEVPDYSKWVQYGNCRPSRWNEDSHHKTLEESEENDAVDPKKLQDLESKKLKYLHHKSHQGFKAWNAQRDWITNHDK